MEILYTFYNLYKLACTTFKMEKMKLISGTPGIVKDSLFPIYYLGSSALNNNVNEYILSGCNVPEI